MRSQFDEQLMLLHTELTKMGALCENAIAISAKALADGDIKTAEAVSTLSAEIDKKERDIEHLCMKLLLQQQPVASDLRVISSALKMVTDLERIGHNSGDIAEIVTMATITSADDTTQIQNMANATIKMITESIDAFVKQDADLARKVIKDDDIVDGYFDTVKSELIGMLNSTNGETVLDLLLIAKYFERMGDHAVVLARWVLFSITGQKE